MEKDRPRVGAGVFILNSKNELLLVHRISKHAHGTWAPPGGWIEYGETFEEVAKRESKEELGIDVSDVEVIGVSNNVYEKEGKHVIAINLKAKKYSGEPKIMEPEKHSELGWFALNNLPSPMMSAAEEFFNSNPGCLCGSGVKLTECHGK